MLEKMLQLMLYMSSLHVHGKESQQVIKATCAATSPKTQVAANVVHKKCFLQREKYLDAFCNILALTLQSPDLASEDARECGQIGTSRGIN